jgi:preprotein translocase subunit SecE
MIDKITNYLKNSKEELRKVQWPSRDETVKKTGLVVVISIIIAVYLGLLDYLLNILLEALIKNK